MKRLAILIGALALMGAGCASAPEAAFEGNAYENTEFHFAFDYPLDHDVHVRPTETRPRDYLGEERDFFLSLRDLEREGENAPLSIAFFYSVPNMTAEDIKTAVIDSGISTEIKEESTQVLNGITFTKIVSDTQLSDDEITVDKVHYLFGEGEDAILISIFIGEDDGFQPMLQTFRPFR